MTMHGHMTTYRYLSSKSFAVFSGRRLRILEMLRTSREEGKTMLWTIFAVFLILWLLGFSLHVGGALIHLLLVVALVVFVINLVSGRRGTA